MIIILKHRADSCLLVLPSLDKLTLDCSGDSISPMTLLYCIHTYIQDSLWGSVIFLKDTEYLFLLPVKYFC